MNFKATLFLIIMIFISSVSLSAYESRPDFLWEKLNESRYEITTANLQRMKITEYEGDFYIALEGRPHISLLINFLPDLIATDEYGKFLMRYDLSAFGFAPGPNDLTRVFQDLSIKNDTIVVATKQLYGTMSRPVITFFQKNDPNFFYRHPDTVISYTSNLGRFWLFNNLLCSFSGMSWICRDYSEEIKKYIPLNVIKEHYPNLVEHDFTIRIQNELLIDEENIAIIVNNPEISKNTLMLLEIANSPSEMVFAYDFDNHIVASYYSVTDSIFWIIDFDTTTKEYRLYHINRQGEIIHSRKIDFDNRYSIQQPTAIKEIGNGKYIGVLGRMPTEKGLFMRFDIFDKEGNLVEYYAWETDDYMDLADYHEKENGNIVLLGGLGFKYYLAEIRPGYLTSVSETSISHALSIHPNPAGDILHIENGSPNSAIEIYSVLGIVQMKLPYSTSIDVSRLPAGVYFLRSGSEFVSFVK